MTDRRRYTYTTLRYVHDTITGEFVNVGVVLVSPDARFVRARMRHTYARLSCVFPNIDRAAFRKKMQRLETRFQQIGRELSKPDLFNADFDAASIAKKIIPADDSSLQWGPVHGGLGSDLVEVLDRLFSRLVSRYDNRSERRRTDDDVWRPVRERLEAREIADCFHEKTITGPDDAIQFKHAWKNGIWHCVQPLSFELADAEGIRDKARRWMGHLAAVSDAAEGFKPYFLVAAPQEKQLQSAFESALSILGKSPQNPEIFLEDEADTLVRKMEREIRSHRGANGIRSQP